MIAYHIDRLNRLSPRQTITLSKVNSDSKEHLDIIEQRYPNGVSFHGVGYYCGHFAKNHNSYNSFLIENIFEYERIINFPHMPSRFESFFASSSMDWSKTWIDKFKVSQCTVWEIDFNTPYVELDASYLFIPPDSLSFIMAADYARKYWSGQVSDNPLMELIISLPVTITQQKVQITQ